MVQIRPAAAQELSRLLHRQQASAPGQPSMVYLALEPGGCADWTYRLTADQPPPQPTTTLSYNDLCLAIPTEQLELVKDLVIDYAEDLMGGGFRFINPLAQRTCGCGNAFALNADTPVTQDCTAPNLSAV
jgi:iron-sulfur cluster assembly protein